MGSIRAATLSTCAVLLVAVGVQAQTTEIVFTHNESGQWSGTPDVGQVFLSYEPRPSERPYGEWVDFPIVPVTSTPRNDDYVFATDGIDWTAETPPAIRLCVDLSARGFGLLCGPWWQPREMPPRGEGDGVGVASSPTGEAVTPVTRPTASPSSSVTPAGA